MDLKWGAVQRVRDSLIEWYHLLGQVKPIGEPSNTPDEPIITGSLGVLYWAGLNLVIVLFVR